MYMSRRTLLLSSACLALVGCVTDAAKPLDTASSTFAGASPVPLSSVRLKPSIYLTSLETNTRYLLSLSPDRLMHNFHKSAGLAPKGELYGGWEARGIAGHSLGHYMTACALMYAQTGNTDVRDRLSYIVAELAQIQRAHGDGYIGGTTVERDGAVVDGKIVYEELRAGEISSSGFDVNGGWVPLYTWHKMQAGLIDAYRHANIETAIPVLLQMADYLGVILEGFTDAQMQKVLAAEHGGLNEAYADLYDLTGETRWLDLAKTIRHKAVLDPLSQGENVLPGLHANTQIPKVIGLARLHDLTGDPAYADTAKYFYDRVTQDYTFAIGGHSDREHFGEPGQLSDVLTDRTCEACNTYNMLKLTRHLYHWTGNADYFDFFERAHLNHIMAHQHPETGGFVYFMPLSAGSKRVYSQPEDSFWCCVGSGMESHSKHGESIYWEKGNSLIVNLYMPSRVTWDKGGMALEMDTDFPFSEQVSLTIDEAPEESRELAFRIPAWCQAAISVNLNGETLEAVPSGGYLLLNRVWRAGDRLDVTLPMQLHTEALPDDDTVTAMLHGPLVLAADVGSASEPFESMPPAIVAQQGRNIAVPTAKFAHYTVPAGKPGELTMKPFFNLYERRAAVYLPTFSEAQ